MEAIAPPPERQLGTRRSIGICILLFVVTLGLYGWYWAFKTQDEIRRASGEGIGGVLGLVIWILIGAVSAFVIPAEVKRMHELSGRPSPVSGWTGLWLFPFGLLVIPAIVWFVKVQGALNRFWEAEGAAA